ncbi:MAG TPA: cytochrome c oxidase subunit 3 [Steroidobacteraceae bacterium]|nr:cytochrome c oxidase subunit 3 [Steroidobacteraceae bacterium]
MSSRPVIDVSRLPTYAFSHRSIMFWGTAGMIVIEGTMFVIALVTYYYLRGHALHWPMSSPPPALIWGTVNTAILIVSGLPNHLAAKASERKDLAGVRLWMLVSVAVAAAFHVVRALEFTTLNTHWSNNAYGSIVFTLLILHTVHSVTDFVDTIVLTALMFTSRITGKRYVDVNENADYWWFIVIAWLPIYFTLYLVPRWFP